MQCLDMKRWLRAALIAAALLSAPAIHAVTPTSWKDTGFSINANGMTLRDVLDEFGRVYGVRLHYELKNNSYLKGRLKAESGSEFLDRLTQPYKFRWFVYNETLYVVPRDDNASMRLEVGENAVQDAKAALIGLGLFDGRFGWGELPDEGTVVVSGPRTYVNLVREVLLPHEGKVPLKGKHIMMFRLKYASATDRVITTRGQTETIPGVKTILSSLLFGPDSNERLSDVRGKFDVGSHKRSREGKSGKGGALELGGKSTILNARAQRESEEEDNDRSIKSKSASREDRPRIEADPSLNAVLIYDNVNKRETYQALIAELDIEPQQIEIEALIVDIDRSKLSELGVEWGVRSGNTVSRINATRKDSQGVELPIPGATLLISNAGRFYARLKALEGDGQARVLAKPTVLTLDNVAAVLDLSQTAYLPLVGERVADLANVTAGTMLRVVPRIVREGDHTRVRLEVDIEDGSLGDAELKKNVTRSTISTQAIIDLQQTLMIGGYHAESISKNQQKVPVLGDVPLVGNLFRSDTESHSSRERLFLITPRLTGTAGHTAPSRSKAWRVARKVVMTDNRPYVNLPQLFKPGGDQAGDNAPPAAPHAAPAWSAAPDAFTSPSIPPVPGGRLVQAAPAGRPLTDNRPFVDLPRSAKPARDGAANKTPVASAPPAAPAEPGGNTSRLTNVAHAEAANASAATSFRIADPIGGTAAQAPVKRKCARPKGTPLMPVEPA